MAELKERLQALDGLESPEIWRDIVTRRPSLPPRRDPSAMRHAAVLVLVTAVTLGAGAGIFFGARSASTSGTSVGPAISSFPAPPSREALARMEAVRLLSSLHLPPGSKESATAPAGSAVTLKEPFTIAASPDLVDLTRYYTVPLAPAAVVAWLKTRHPKEATLGGSGTVSGPGGTYAWELGLTWPLAKVQPRTSSSSGQVIDSAGIAIEAISLSAGQSALRVDAEVTWLPAKNKADLVPFGMKLLTASVPGSKTAAVTTHSRSVIERLRKAIDALPVASPGARSCPADLFGHTVRLVFASHAGVAPAAVVQADESGCGFVSIMVGGKTGRALSGGVGIFDLAARLLGIKASSGL